MEPLKVLSKYTADILNQKSDDEDQLKVDFELLLEYCLWGNKCDLSLTAGLHAINDLEKSKEFKALLQHIISNHTSDVWKHLLALRKNTDGENRRVDFVLDNAGFELFTDLCFAIFLLEKGFCDEIVFHVKSIPWFVSDAMEKDIHWTIDECIKHRNDSNVAMLGGKWKKLFDTRKFQILKNNYWTLASDYSELQSMDPELYNYLAKSNLLFFKGDLNYRKLVGDRKWVFTTPFSSALCGFQPTAVCSLRTLKADVVVGLPEGKSGMLEKEDPDWMVNAKYGVIQFSK